MEKRTKDFLLNQLMWMAIYFAAGIPIMLLVPFPYSLILIIPLVMGLGYYRRRRYMRKMGISESGGFFGPSVFRGAEQSTVYYYCMDCGRKHSQASCPNCGSKLKRVGF